MSGRIVPVSDRYWKAGCDLCPWTSGPLIYLDAKSAQENHETECRPPTPDVIPDIDFPYPPCPICDGELTHDDGWWCDRCQVAWPNNGTGGEHQPDEPLPAVGSGSRPVPAASVAGIREVPR